MNNFFKSAGNLDDVSRENKNHFMKAGDLSYQKDNVDNKENINDYLVTIISGKKYPAVCELGVLMGAGRTIVNYNQLKRMVNEGYNIVNANVINNNSDMIEVEYQKYIYDEELMERRRRF